MYGNHINLEEDEMRRYLLVVATITLVGCASTSANLQRETARSIGYVKPEQVTVSEVKRGITDVRWKADSPKGKYDCSADDMLRRVHCVKE